LLQRLNEGRIALVLTTVVAAFPASMFVVVDNIVVRPPWHYLQAANHVTESRMHISYNDWPMPARARPWQLSLALQMAA
jgi:hypothetical protein